MIPSDLAARLRLLADSAVQALPQIRPLPNDLPEFQRGQRFTAQLQSALPDGSFRAVVAGKTVTLALEQAAKAGDTLELVVVDRSPKLIAASLAAQSTTAEPTPTLSRAAQLISALLTGGRNGTSEPAVLARGQPLLASSPESAAQLAPLLKQAALQSGLFYESHQAQWIAGRMPLAALLQEPQGQQSPLLQAADRASSPAHAPPSAVGARAPEIEGGRTPAAGVPSRGTEAPSGDVAAPVTGRAQAAQPSSPSMAHELAPIVQQQLDSLATHHLAWQGQMWPGQDVRWEIEEPLRDRDPTASDDPTQWRTTLRLSMPMLGNLAATLTLTPTGVAVALEAGSETSVARLHAGREQLESALAAAGVPLLGLKVHKHDAD